MAASMRSVVRAAYSGRLRRVERERRRLQLGERLQQVAARLGQKHQQPEDQEDREQRPSA